MGIIMVTSFILVLLLLNIFFLTLHREEKVNLMVSGLIMMVLTPTFSIMCDLARENLGDLELFLSIATFMNGFLIFSIGLIIQLIQWVPRIYKRR